MPRRERRTRPGLACLLALAVALAPALTGLLAAPSALAQNGAREGQAPDQNGSEEGANRSDGQGQGANDSRGEGADRGANGERGPPEERGRAPPVDVEDRPGGFATRAPPDSPRPEVAVDARNATASVARPDVTPMDVHLDQVVEFTDRDGDGGYDVGEPVVNRTTLSAAPSSVLADPANETRILVYEIGGGAELRLVFDLGTSHGEQVASKFDVVIEGYDFANADTRIALGSRIQVDGGLERVEREGQPAVAGEQGEDVAYLSWVPTVQVDGVDHEVASSVHVDAEQPAESAIVYWAYPQGEEIVHDPELGVSEAIRDLAGRLSPFALGLAGTVAVLGLGYAARARWGA